MDARDPDTVQDRAFGDRPPPQPGEGQLAGVRGVESLEDMGQRLARGLDPKALHGGRRFRPLVAQRLQQAAHAGIVEGRAEQDRHDAVALQGVGEVGVDLLLGRGHVLEELLQELVVVIGKPLQKLLAGLLLALLQLGRDRDQVRGLAGVVVIGPLAHHIDIAYRLVALADRHLAQHQGPRRDRLQPREHVADAAHRGVDLVDEQDVRDRAVVEELEQRGHRDRPLDDRLDDHHRQIGDHQRGLRLIGELDRAGAVDEGPGIAQELGRGHIDLGAHLAGLGHRAGVADRAAILDRALTRDGAGQKQKAFEQCGLAAEVWADEHRNSRARHRFGWHPSRSQGDILVIAQTLAG
jgi:hypothetical protein